MTRKISRRRSKQRGSLGEVRSRNTLKGFEPLERRQMLAMVVDDFIKIASNTGGGPALQNEDKFGRSVANIGDVDGDGVIDVAVGTTRDDTGGVQRGALYILFMNSDGTVRDHQKIASGVGNGPSLDDRDYFGRSVAAIGDIDGDGVPDIVVGADGDDTGGADRGVVYLLRLNRDGSVKSRSRIGSSLNGGPTLDDGDEFGRAVAYLGDLNGDGYPELAVAARGDDRGGTDRGAVYVLSLAPDGSVNGTKKLANNLNNVPPLPDNASFGRSLGFLGDVDGDGIGDLAVGAYTANANGAAHILFLNSDGSVKRSERHTGGGSFGSAVSAAGDLDGDGILDILVGANRSSPVIDNVLYRYSGAIYTILLNPDGSEKLRGRIDASTGRDRGLGLPLRSGDYFGRSIDSLGDINGDGKPEFAVGARGDSSVGTDRGAVYVLTLTPGAFISGTKFLDVNSNGLRDKNFLVGTAPDVTFVIDVSGSSLDVLSGESVGDVNGDGVSNSVLDVELQCVLELTNALTARGQSENVRVSIIVFSSSAEPVDMDLVSSGDQFWTRPNADIDGNGVPDVEDVVRQIGAGHNNTGTGTDFSDALAAAVDLQGVLQTPNGQGNVIFMSDGDHNGSDFLVHVDALRSSSTNLRAFGIGVGVDPADMLLVDPEVYIVNTSDALIELFVLQGYGLYGEYVEPGLADVAIFLDLNNNGMLDSGEPVTTTAADDTSTPDVDESGQYVFAPLFPGDYIVREELVSGFTQTYPSSGYHAFTASSGVAVNDVDFGNAANTSVPMIGPSHELWEDFGSVALSFELAVGGYGTQPIAVDVTTRSSGLTTTPRVEHRAGERFGSIEFSTSPNAHGRLTFFLDIQDSGVDQVFDSADDKRSRTPVEVVIHPRNDVPQLAAGALPTLRSVSVNAEFPSGPVGTPVTELLDTDERHQNYHDVDASTPWVMQEIKDDLSWVIVGHPSNAPDVTGFGSVDSTYRIMTFEFTNAEYVIFLNSVDPTGRNPYGVYNPKMGSNDVDASGGIQFNASAPVGSKYIARDNMANKPVNWVSWFDAARVANWLHNDMDGGSTEFGSYDLQGRTSGSALAPSPKARYFLPSEDQWYKAAFYMEVGGYGDYWSYATQSDVPPAMVTANATGDGSAGGEGNFANFARGADWGNQNGNVTSVGTNGSPSAYGAFDMSGNVWEWNGTGLRGGGWAVTQSSDLSSSRRNNAPLSGEYASTGFRLASRDYGSLAPHERALPGIAITSVNAGDGTLWATTNYGQEWIEVEHVSPVAPLFLRADASNRLYYKPAPGERGYHRDIVSFRAWDGTDSWQASGPHETLRPSSDAEKIMGPVAISSNGTQILVAGFTAAGDFIRVLSEDAATGEWRKQGEDLLTTRSDSDLVAMSGDASAVVSVGPAASLVVNTWNTAADRWETTTIALGVELIANVVMSSDGSTIIATGGDNNSQAIHTYRVVDGSSQWIEVGDPLSVVGRVRSIACSADGSVVAFTTEDESFDLGDTFLYRRLDANSGWSLMGNGIPRSTFPSSWDTGWYRHIDMSSDGMTCALVFAYWVESPVHELGVSATVFDWNESANTWQQRSALPTVVTTGGDASSEFYPTDMAITGDGTRVMIALMDEDSAGAPGYISSYQWDSDRDQWEVLANEVTGQQWFGDSMAVSKNGGRLAAGVPQWGSYNEQGEIVDSGSGYVAVYNLAHTTSLAVDTVSTFIGDQERLVRDTQTKGAGSNPGADGGFVVLGNNMFFTATDADGTELRVLDLTKSEGTPGYVTTIDIADGPVSSDPGRNLGLMAVGSLLFFDAYTQDSGHELHVLDTTKAVTADGYLQVVDIEPGQSFSSPGEYGGFAQVGTQIFFDAADGTSGRELWFIDTTKSYGEPGYLQTRDIRTSSGSSYPGDRAGFTAVGSRLFFDVNAGEGTEVGIVDTTKSPDDADFLQVVDIAAGSLSSNPSLFTAAGDYVFFSASDGIAGTELWMLDLTKQPGQGDYLRSFDISPGAASSQPGRYLDFTLAGNHLLFDADDGTNGRELWFVDLTQQANSQDFLRTVDIRTGSTGSIGFGDSIAAAGSQVFLSADTDEHGSEAIHLNMTKASGADDFLQVVDINPGKGSSFPGNAGFAQIGTQIFFEAYDGTSGTELWFIDTTKSYGEPGYLQTRDIRTSSGSSTPGYYAGFTAVGSRLFFDVHAGSGTEVGIVDTTKSVDDADFLQVVDIASGSLSSRPALFTAAGDYVFFSADDGRNGRELWRISNTTELSALPSPVQLRQGMVTEASAAAIGVGAGDSLYYRSTDSVWGSELRVLDTTLPPTHDDYLHTVDINPGQGSSSPGYYGGFTQVGTQIFFDADDGTSGRELWFIDTTKSYGEPGYLQTRDIRTSSGSSYPGDRAGFTAVGSRLFFDVNAGEGTEVGIVDTTKSPDDADFLQVVDIAAGSLSSNPALFTAAGDYVFFSASDGIAGTELWMLDVTKQPGQADYLRSFDISPGEASSLPGRYLGFTLAGDHLLFDADDGVGGRELWFVDLTQEVTSQEFLGTVDIRTGSTGSIQTRSKIAIAGSQVWLSAVTDEHGWEAIHLDMTKPSGADDFLQVVDINPGQGSSYPGYYGNFAQVGTQIFFDADDGTFGRELWFIDRAKSYGEPGYLRTHDIAQQYSGASSYPGIAAGFTIAGSRLFFDVEVGDGPDVGIVDTTKSPDDVDFLQVVDFTRGYSENSPSRFTAAGDYVFFSADGDSGRELYSILAAAENVSSADITRYDIWQGTESSYPTGIAQYVASDSHIYFFASRPDVQRGLFSLSFINEPPAGLLLANTVASIDENSDVSQRRRLADIVVGDDDRGTNSVSLLGPDDDSFEVIDSVLYLRQGVALDYETKRSFTVDVSVADSTLAGTSPVTETYTLLIKDVNEAPTGVGLTNAIESIEENTSITPDGLKLADISVVDDAITAGNVISLSGPDAVAFEILGRQLFLKSGTSLNHESQQAYEVTVEVADLTIAGSSPQTVDYRLAITDVNESPVDITVSSSTVAEHSPLGTVVGVFSAVDEDAGDTATFTLTAGDGDVDNAVFLISGASLLVNADVDFEKKTEYSVRVKVEDHGGLSVEKKIAFSVLDVNEPPLSVSLLNILSQLDDDADTTTRLKVADIIVHDDALGTNTLTLAGEDRQYFEVDESVLYLKANTVLDVRQKEQYRTVVSAVDTTLPGTEAVSNEFTLTIKAPEVIVTVDEGASVVDDNLYKRNEVIVKRGKGTLILSKENAHRGGIRIEEGHVVVSHTMALNRGPVTVQDGASLKLETGLTMVSVESIAFGTLALVDLGQSGFLLPAGGVDAVSLRQGITNGRNGGGWDGSSGVTSSEVGANTSHGVGYYVAANGDVTVRYTKLGDSELNGRVDFDDILALFPNYGIAGSFVWQEGDFTYDNKVDFDDILALFPNYGSASLFGGFANGFAGSAGSGGAGAAAGGGSDALTTIMRSYGRERQNGVVNREMTSSACGPQPPDGTEAASRNMLRRPITRDMSFAQIGADGITETSLAFAGLSRPQPTVPHLGQRSDLANGPAVGASVGRRRNNP